jgi:hypothetical protein
MQFYTIDSIVELRKLKASAANKISLATKLADHACPAPSFDHALAWDTSGWCVPPHLALFHQCYQPCCLNHAVATQILSHARLQVALKKIAHVMDLG